MNRFGRPDIMPRWVIATLILTAGCGSGDCPPGFLRDNDGNCIQVEYGAEDSDTAGTEETAPPADCEIAISVDGDCSACVEGIYFTIYEWNYSSWATVDTWHNLSPGESESWTLAPSPDEEVKFDYNVWFGTGTTDNPCGAADGTEFADCPSGSGETYHFSCD